MSADTPSEPKYATGASMFLSDDIALTDHAIHRYRQRTPHENAVGIRDAWRHGEDIRHPAVASKKSDHELDTVRVYKHGDAWGVAFLVVEDTRKREDHFADRVVATVVNLAGFEHGPSRAYLHSHGPHGGESR